MANPPTREFSALVRRLSTPYAVTMLASAPGGLPQYALNRNADTEREHHMTRRCLIVNLPAIQLFSPGRPPQRGLVSECWVWSNVTLLA